MPSRRNRNVRPQSVPEHDRIAYTPTAPLIQLDNSPLSSNLQLERNLHPDQLFARGEAVAAPDDDGLLVKHEGGSISPIPILAALPSSSHPEASAQGHMRSPVLAREPTMLEAFSRAVRDYVPSSISIPTAAPSPPRVSKPVSFGSFDVHSRFSPAASEERHTQVPHHRRRLSGASGTHHPSGSTRVYSGHPLEPDPLLGSEEDGDTGASSKPTSPSTAYPTVGEGDPVVWSRWDTLMQQDAPRCILFLGYPCGCQIWDCTDLGSVSEILNLTASSWGRISFAGVLASPPLTDDDHLRGLRPLIGVICHLNAESFMVIYSLRSHQIVKRLPFRNVVSFDSGTYFTIISTTNPINLHVLSSASYTILHTIPSSNLAYNSLKSTSAAAQNQQNTNNQVRNVSLSNIDTPSHHRDVDVPIRAETREEEAEASDFVPVYALSHRLLAFASQPPRLDACHEHRHGTPSHPRTQDPRTHDRSSSFPSSSSTLPFGIAQISQADLGNTAVKVGGTVLSGMKSLGGMALSAATGYARSRVGSRGVTGETRPHQPLLPSSVAGGVSSMFFSRSAPAEGHQRSGQAPAGCQGGDEGFSQDYPASHDRSTNKWWTSKRDQPSYIRVLDLSPLLNCTQSELPDPVAEFVVAKRHGIRHLTFTRDGNSVAVTLTDGQVVRMFQLRPLPKTGGCGSHGAGVDVKGTRTQGGTGRGECPTDPSSLTTGDSAPWHIYNLRRGHTPGVIEGIDISPDGRWVAIGSGNRTVHVFSINPYGGKPDRRSHVDARIWNVDRPQPLSTELLSVARLRFPRSDPAFGSVPQGPLSFIFLPGDIHMPGSLLPLPPPPVVASSPSTSSARSDLGRFPSSRSRNYKDILVFDPPSGILSLRRITMEERPKESSISSPITSFATSISFPGTGYANRLGNSPPTQSSKEGRKTSGLTQQLLDVSVELVGKERVVATWQLRRRQDWGEVKQVMSEMSEQKRVEVSDSLAHAELSTFSRHPEIVPRSVYLSHQFLFYTLGEDYHALIRRLRFGIKGDKVVVRREVEPSYVASGTALNMGKGTVRGANELFVTGTHGGLDHRAASSFDEPLANAIASGLDGPSGVPSIPMFPNGTGGRPRPFGVAALPIKSLKEGVGEGLDRLRREMHRVRSPKEHDGRRHLGVDPEGASEGSGISGVTGVSLPTPSTHTDLLDVEEKDVGRAVDGDLDEGEFGGEGGGRGWDWAEEDKRAVDEAEQFDDVLGFMDEDQTPALRTAEW